MVLHDETYYIDRVKAGDKEAFTWLVDQYRDMIYTVCLRMLSAEVDAEEAAQDAFVKAYRSLASFQGKSKFSTWIYRIAYNQCIGVIRKRVRMIDMGDDLPDGEISEWDVSGLDTISAEERSKYLQMAIEALGETDSVVITLFYYEELSLDEIAEITDLTSSNIRIKLHRSRKKMYQVINNSLKSEVSSIL